MSVEAHASRAGSLWRRVSRRHVVAALILAGVVWGITFIFTARETSDMNEATASFDATALAQTRDLVETVSFDGTLGYGDARPLVVSSPGTLTDLADEGATVRRGQALYSVDGRGVPLFYGALPMYRDLSSSSEEGRDIRQLEANLAALDFDPYDEMELDNEWDYATTAAVNRWKAKRGETEDGVVASNEIVFLPGARVVGEHAAEVGATVSPGVEVFSTSSSVRSVTLDVEVADADQFSEGDRVSVQLPTGRGIRGTISSIGKVATTDEGSDAGPKVEVLVSLGANVKRGGFDQASVEVEVETARARDALSVPVSALVATTDGFAVEVVRSKGTELADVEPGAYADGWVEVQGSGITEGTKVVTAP